MPNKISAGEVAILVLVSPLLVVMSPFLLGSAVIQSRREKAYHKKYLKWQEAQAARAREERQKHQQEQERKFLEGCAFLNTFRETSKLEFETFRPGFTTDFLYVEDIPESIRFLLQCNTSAELIQQATPFRALVISLCETVNDRLRQSQDSSRAYDGAAPFDGWRKTTEC